MNLNPDLLKNIPYNNPTPIQRKIIPMILERKNVMGIGRTGSGKTMCYLIPSIQKALENIKTLIIVPTRELMSQVKRNLKFISRNLDIENMIEVNTAGRYENTDVGFFVVDEVDRMLEEPDLKREFEFLNNKLECQKAFFSATKPDIHLDIKMIEVDNKLNENIKHYFFYVQSISKEAALLHFLNQERKTIVFVGTKYTVDYLLEVLHGHKIEAKGIYSSMDNGARHLNLKGFAKGDFNVLIVTDLAARGLDIPVLDTTINYDLCDERTFVHRVGRVRGMGEQYSFVSYNDVFHFFNIQETYLPDVEIGTIPQDILDQYDISKFIHAKAKTIKGYEKCLKFRRKVSCPDEYKDKIANFKVHSIFENKSTLSQKLTQFYNSKTVPREKIETKENKFKDQTFIPYSRKDSRIHSSAFAVMKDDYVKERKEKFGYKRAKGKKK
ncbi:ATP-dependent RNA helicase DDX54 [Nosema bombycis CQ1]|uniref:ATP-dependent RNA helicase DDX54 n=1 Tax=Nosema bombycis (strain CQ1 / CVCC 102059) TaxID=578461 RepID=R0MH62_NOSB1|nr:ATP-dependent RNA helicase DDX54 [Nosema bombycis CQ1]|eukprot:EOB12133.1 ATP-dependent RNA helicase DDX54 [Nosema bombycis CQ1]